MVFRIVAQFFAALITFSGSVSVLSAHEVQRFGVLPLNSNPGGTFFQGRNGYLYGVLAETNLQVPRHAPNGDNPAESSQAPNGAVYEISPTGSLRYLHQFPYVWATDEPNTTGAAPADLLTMGRDGFLYGFTRIGGIYATGVFYRLGVDGSYEVIAHFDGRLGSSPSFFNGLCEGPDNAFYVSDTYFGRILRFGLDGTVSTITSVPVTTAQLFFFAPGSSSAVLTWRARIDPSHPELGEQRTIRRIGIPSGQVLDEISVPALPGMSGEERVVAVTEEEVFVYSESSNLLEKAPGRLVSFARDGTATLISEFAGPGVNSSTLPPCMWDFIVAEDGGFYFSAYDPAVQGNPRSNATRLFRLFRDGTFSQICEFDEALLNLAYGSDHFLYCLSLGSDFTDAGEVPVPEETSTRQALSPVKFRLSNTSSARSRVRSGTFRVKPKTGIVSLAPLARQDSVILPRRSKPITVPVLKNDRDPEGGPLTITGISTPRFGSAVLATGKKGIPEIVYTPGTSPSSSEIVDYTITDADGRSSTGQMAVRGDVGGVYRQGKNKTTEEQNADTLAVRIAPNGGFTAKAIAAGVTLKGSGRLNFSDAARIVRKPRSGIAMTLDLRVETSGTTKVLKYQLTVGSQTFTGTIARN